MNEIKYLCMSCGRGHHRQCVGEAFYELRTDVDTRQQEKRVMRCECPHIAPGVPQ